MDKIFDADQLETPSMNFTANVLETLEHKRESQLVYTPLLPKWVFGVLGVLLVVFVFYVFNVTDGSSSGINYFESLNFSTSGLTQSLLKLNFSKILGYSVLAMGLLVCLQASLLNKFLNRTNSMI